MRRRDFITLVGSAATWPLSVGAQQLDKVRLIGVLIGVADDTEGQARLGAFRQGMQTLRWVDGRNVRIVARFATTEPDRKADAAELVGLAPEVILANTAPVARSLLEATKTVPIVFAQIPDPVGLGLISNLPHPGGNITGFTSFEYAMSGKWIELLKEIAPGVSRILAIGGGTNIRFLEPALNTMKMAATSYRVELTSATLSNAADIERTISSFANEPNGGLILVPEPIATVQLELFVALAARYRLPAIYPYRYFVTRGGLSSYGIDNLDLFRKAATYVDRILKGEKAGDLPVQAPTKFEFVLNLKVAKALGLELGANVLTVADEVIE
jgi:putative tryptophan/tyrosine transport system substrate-binding protein